MGNEVEDILHSYGLGEEDAKKYDTVSGKFQEHFLSSRNVIFERVKLKKNQRKQQEDESADSFITALFTLVEHCYH